MAEIDPEKYRVTTEWEIVDDDDDDDDDRDLTIDPIVLPLGRVVDEENVEAYLE